jgi:hypothetical protein
MRDLPCHPLVLRVGAGHPLGGFRVLDETLSVVGYPPDVKVVIEYSVTALSVAIDRRSVPLTSAWARYALTIESRGYLPRCHSFCIFLEDP